MYDSKTAKWRIRHIEPCDDEPRTAQTTRRHMEEHRYTPDLAESNAPFFAPYDLRRSEYTELLLY